MRHHIHSRGLGFSSNPWIVAAPLEFPPRYRLFCFPFAGGGAATYSPWRKFLAHYGIDVCAVQLPGRETRFRDEPIRDLATLIEKLTPALLPCLDLPFSFFGHSMGTLIAFELTRSLAKQGERLPEWLLVSAAVAPHRRPPGSIHTLPDSEFLDELARRYQGMPEEVRKDSELRELFLPVLRADFELIERYQFQPGVALPVKLTAFGGRADTSVSTGELEGWRDLTARQDSFGVALFEGDHFFLNTECKSLTEKIRSLLG